jgi:hypothetical protein
MVLAGDTLFVAGPPERSLRSAAAFSDKRNGILCAVSAKNGETLEAYRLDGRPAYDGMAAAGGRLYLSMEDGRLLCLGDGTAVPGSGELEALSTPLPLDLGRAREPGLAGHWPLDEGRGTIGKDESGLENNAEVRGSWARGEFGTCVATGGAPGAVTIWDGPHLHFGTSSFTIQFWVQLDHFDCRILGKEDFPRSWWVINVLRDGRAELVLGKGRERGKTVRSASNGSLSKGGWTHVAFVVDRNRRQVRCHLNGALESTTTIPPALAGDLNVEGKDLRIPSSYKPYSGLFDELKIYHRALEPAEIQASFERERKNRFSPGIRGSR